MLGRCGLRRIGLPFGSGLPHSSHPDRTPLPVTASARAGTQQHATDERSAGTPIDSRTVALIPHSSGVITLSTSIFGDLESNVRSYCRSRPAVFETARGSRLHAEDGEVYLDFFSGAGALNYGHSDPDLKRALIEYLADDGVVHSLDTCTTAKRHFLTAFEHHVLRPRGLDNKVQFTGPTGTDSVEAALELARLTTGPTGVVTFTNAFHGMTLGSLSVTGNAMKRNGAGVPLSFVTTAPYDGYLDDPSWGFAWLAQT